jgi:5-methyltetrahydropteroyltriglutamate--homocysteine methyltransferase
MGLRNPSGEVLNSFIGLNKMGLSGFSAEQRRRAGMHSGVGRGFEPTRSGDEIRIRRMTGLFALQATNFYIALAGKKDNIVGAHHAG